MDFKNRVKGSVTQTLFKALLEDAGYQLVPLGIEEVIREVKALPISQYMDLGLPPVLGRMPDFFIADKSFKETWLVEVKYRKQWNDNTRASLGREIEEQVKIWQPISLVLFLGERARETDTPASSIGVLRLIHAEGELLCSWFENDFFTNELKEYRTLVVPR